MFITRSNKTKVQDGSVLEDLMQLTIENILITFAEQFLQITDHF